MKLQGGAIGQLLAGIIRIFAGSRFGWTQLNNVSRPTGSRGFRAQRAIVFGGMVRR